VSGVVADVREDKAGFHVPSSESRPAGTDVVVDLDAERLQEPPESIRWQEVEIHPKLWKVFE